MQAENHCEQGKPGNREERFSPRDFEGRGVCNSLETLKELSEGKESSRQVAKD